MSSEVHLALLQPLTLSNTARCTLCSVAPLH
jgi:hypothetical protein